MAVILSGISPAGAWENHQSLMERLMDARIAKQRIYPYQKITVPCPADEKNEIAIVAKALDIDGTKIPVFSRDLCSKNQTSIEINMSELLVSGMIDEPDLGMDQNLPESMDPHHYRNWMGGSKGPTSQGFRHMVFPGVDLRALRSTFQIPLSSIGEALERIEKIRNVSDAYFRTGNKFWGLRTLLWELHYVQDLHQPFHVAQVPSLHMIPWKKLFSGFVSASTHAMANYHYAYESLAQGMAKEALSNGFQKCFEPEVLDDPRLKIDMLEKPRAAAATIGSAVYEALGDRLKSDDVDLPAGIGQIDTFALLHVSEAVMPLEADQKEISSDELKSIQNQINQSKAMTQLKTVTCELMSTLSRNTWLGLDRAFVTGVDPKVQNPKSSKTGKWSEALPEIRRSRR